jgi:hypothetical protein
VDIDLRNEKIGYKVREHSHAKVPVMIVLGKREVDERAVNIRRLGSKDQESMSLEAATQALRRRPWRLMNAARVRLPRRRRRKEPSPFLGEGEDGVRYRAFGEIVLYPSTDMGESCVLRLAPLDRRKG